MFIYLIIILCQLRTWGFHISIIKGSFPLHRATPYWIVAVCRRLALWALETRALVLFGDGTLSIQNNGTYGSRRQNVYSVVTERTLWLHLWCAAVVKLQWNGWKEIFTSYFYTGRGPELMIVNHEIIYGWKLNLETLTQCFPARFVQFPSVYDSTCYVEEQCIGL
jgi:hypothetical protein